MKKILLALGIIFTGLCLTACGGDDMGGTAEEQAAVNAVSTMISIANRGELQRDFYLTRTTLGADVEVTWTSSNSSLIAISTVDYKGQYDTQEYEYSLATITQTNVAKDVSLTAKLKKGGAELALPFNCRVIEDQFVNITTYAELLELENGDKVRVTVTVDSFYTSSSGNVTAYVIASGDTEQTFSVFLGRSTTWNEFFVIGNSIIVESTRDFYNGNAQLKSPEFVKFA